MSRESQKVEYLIVDTSAFIRNAALQDIGVNIITEQDVVNEITNKRQLRRLVVLPYDLTVKNAFPEDIKFVTEFAKKTGDYGSLSATDIKVIALTYQLEKEKVGTENIRTEPMVPKTVDSSQARAEDLLKPMAGFYMPQKKKGEQEDTNDDTEEEDVEQQTVEQKEWLENEAEQVITVDTKDENVRENKDESTTVDKDQDRREDKDEKESHPDCANLTADSESDYETADSETEPTATLDLSARFSKLSCEPTEFTVKDANETVHNVDEILVPVNLEKNEEEDYSADEDDDYDEEEDEDDEDDGDNGWITPKNITAVKKEIDGETLEEKPVTVACLTMDFAMQNVLKQMGLHVAALDGRVIKQMRTFIFRCHACFKTTSIMTKVFCPSCGNKTLKKVAVSYDQDGNQQIHINFRRPISKKGKRFSLPMPKGGKHANNPILCEDQPVPDQRPTRLARTKNDPLQDDYIAGYSPFIMRDVYSKSAMLGIRPGGGGVKYWMKKNPNESRRKRK